MVDGKPPPVTTGHRRQPDTLAYTQTSERASTGG